MSSSDFGERYRLMTCVALGGGIRTHHALVQATGRVVMVHLLDDSDPGVVAAFRGVVERVPPPYKSRILETATTPTGFAVVTDFIQGMSSFHAWLEARVPHAFEESTSQPSTPAGNLTMARAAVSPPSPPSPPSAPSPTAAAMERSEFTQLFGQMNVPPAGSARSSSPATPSPVASAPAPPAAKGEGGPRGEFTQLFGAATPGPAAAPQPAAPVAPPLPPIASTRNAGEFTRLFQGGTGTPAAPPPSSFTSPPAPRGVEPIREQVQASPPSSPHGAISGGATQAMEARAPARDAVAKPLFGAEAPSAFPPVPPPSPAFMPPPPAAMPPMPAVPPAPSAVVPPASVLPPPLFKPIEVAAPPPPRSSPVNPAAPPAGGSEYTRILRSAPTPPAPAPLQPVSPVRPVAAPALSFPFGLIIALNVVLMLAIALVLYFVLRPRQPPAVSPASTPPAASSAPATPATPATPAAPAPR